MSCNSSHTKNESIMLRYISTIFAFQEIPYKYISISLLFAQRMNAKTHKIHLRKPDKEELAQILDCSLKSVERLIIDCKKYNILKPTKELGVFKVDLLIFPFGEFYSIDNLRVAIDFFENEITAKARITNLTNGEIIEPSVAKKIKK